jgi:hypothetical protein
MAWQIELIQAISTSTRGDTKENLHQTKPVKMGEGGYKQINKALDVSYFEDYLGAQQSKLPTLANVQQLSRRVIRVLGQNPGKVNW